MIGRFPRWFDALLDWFDDEHAWLRRIRRGQSTLMIQTSEREARGIVEGSIPTVYNLRLSYAGVVAVAGHDTGVLGFVTLAARSASQPRGRLIWDWDLSQPA